MQIDKWPTHIEQDYEAATEEAPHNPIRPRASLLNPYGLKEQRVIPNPRTPIPARASANQHVRRTGKLAEESDVTRLPTMPPASSAWQDEDFMVESSVASLSLSRRRATAIEQLDTMPPPLSPTVDELDTIPPLLSPVVAKRTTISLPPAIDERDTISQLSPSLDKQNTVPPQLSPSIDELVTQPPQRKETSTVQKDAVLFTRQHSPSASISPATVESILLKGGADGTSWTTAQGKDSWLAQRVASKKRDDQRTRKSFNPLDSLRWWLLYPGRIEFLLWFNGAIVLVVITFLLFFATTLSLGWLNIGGATNNGTNGMQNAHANGNKPAPAQTPCTAANAKKPQCRSTTVSSSGLQLTLVDNNVLYASTSIYLHGQGFSANGTVALTYDAQLPCHPNITQTDAQGTFSISLLLGSNVQAGKHQIIALDMASSHAVKVTVDIAASQTNTIVSPSTGQPGANPSSGNGQGGAPKPIGQTPVPVAPTVAVSPTSVPTQVPSPTVGVSPSPTIGTTPTVGITTTPSTNSYLALRNTLYNESADGHYSINPWLWVAILGYMLSMTMLGLAGLLYRRKRRQAS